MTAPAGYDFINGFLNRGRVVRVHDMILDTGFRRRAHLQNVAGNCRSRCQGSPYLIDRLQQGILPRQSQSRPLVQTVTTLEPELTEPTLVPLPGGRPDAP